MHITRARLENRKTGTYDDTGRHLAVYVEPIGDYSDADYVANFTKVAAVFLPKAFATWKGLRSFDVCQEPLPSVDDSPEPPSRTQLDVTRRVAQSIRWSRVSLADVLTYEVRHKTADAQPLYEYFDLSLRDQPGYQQAKQQLERSSDRAG